MTETEPRVFGGRYEVGPLLGRGGMAQVFLGTDRVLGRRVALKVLEPHFARDAGFVERFRREAQAAARLTHPNVVNVFDTGSDGGAHFIVMEYVRGRTLAETLAKERIHPERAAEIAHAAAGALAFAHREGLVHRDVKPGNIMLTQTGDVKLMDFGIARAMTSEPLTQTATVMGTAAYFSPEQAQGKPVDARSDIYSLGCVLYEMLAGRPPFTADSPLAVAYKHVREEPVPLRRLNPDVPPALEAIVRKAMAKDPQHRYGTAEALRADLGRFHDGAPVGAGAAAPTQRVAAAHTQRVAATPTQRMPARSAGPTPTQIIAEEERGSRTWLVVLLVFVILLLLGVGLFFLVDTLLRNNDPATETVPNIRGRTLAVAQDILRQDNFESTVGQRIESEQPADIVLDYDPKEGIPGEDVISLVVSAGPSVELIEVPDVVCAPLEEAVGVLEVAGLVVDEGGEEPNEQCPEGGAVARTDPEAGEEVEEGATVTVFVVPAPVLPPAAPSDPDLAPGSDSGLSNEDDVTNATSLTFVGTSDPDVTILLFRDGAEVATATADGSGNWSVTDPGSVPEGTHGYTVRARDDDGRTSEPSAPREVVVDLTAPDTTITSGPSGDIEVGETQAEFEFTASEEGSTFECSLDGGERVACESPQSYQDLGAGPHLFEVVATDAAGNIDPSPAQASWVVIGDGDE